MEEEPSKFLIPGVISQFSNSQLIISSGIPTLDELLGGGIPVGTITLIEEDTQAIYSRIILKYFIAEGVVNNHEVFVASQDLPPQNIVRQLPALIETKHGKNEDDEEETEVQPKRKMKIAFRYDNLPTKEKESKQKFGHYYDLSSVMSKEMIEKCSVTYWENGETKESNSFSNPNYYDLLNSIRDRIISGNFAKDGENAAKNILRLGIYGLGSPMWFVDSSEKNTLSDLSKFLYCLRDLLKQSKVAAMITIPSHLFEEFRRVVHLADISIRLQALAGTELEHNKYLADYHGYFHIDKLAAVNSFKSAHPGSIEYMFKLRRKKFIIEKLHLPPDIDDSDGKNQTPSLGCGSSTKHLLEF